MQAVRCNIAAGKLNNEKRSKPLSNVPPIALGGQAIDGGYLILTEEEKENLLAGGEIHQALHDGKRFHLDFLSGEIIPGDKLFTMPNAKLFEFGVLTSNLHMAWMRVVCGG